MKTIDSLLPVVALTTALAPLAPRPADLTKPFADPTLVFEERDGVVAVEAEHFYKQTLTDKRAWHITTSKDQPNAKPDGDPAHLIAASGGAYVESLPDTRRTHEDKLIKGENFSNEPGKLAVLHYRVHFNTPGRYYVWVRAFSTGTEDNGIHVGINGTWPESGMRMQWCDGKQTWHWESKQRTEKNHCGEPYKIFLDVANAGEHEITFSLREDGFEFDKFILTANHEFNPPEDSGLSPRLKSGTLPPTFAAKERPTEAMKFPSHWGAPPKIQTRDYRPLPGDFGYGSSTLAKWIQQNLDKDASNSTSPDLLALPRLPDGNGTIEISGDLKQWHKVTLTLDGPFAHERDTKPNPFTDYKFWVTFYHESGSPRYHVPGYFAADGNAGNTGAESGTKWRVHLSPDKPGCWNYTVNIQRGPGIAFADSPSAEGNVPGNEAQGSFTIGASDKTGRDFRAHGRLQYVGRHHLQFGGSKEYFLKAGPDAPETLLAYTDFDNTTTIKPDKGPLKTWEPHIRDWKPGNPTWHDGKGKGLIGALNYLATKGVNAFSFLTYNAAGDGDNVWPFVERDTKLHYDCSKLDQWGVVFDHATSLGLYLHFKLQENEMDDNRLGSARKERPVPESLDGGRLGLERKLYCRELIARFGHALALNWNIGEENTQSSDEIRDMVKFLHDTDPYHHHIVIHTFPPQQDEVYRPLLGEKSLLTGVSLQNPWNKVHQRTLQWIHESANSGRPWVVANDEQNPANLGVPPDPGYRGHTGIAEEKRTTDDETGNIASKSYNLHDIRKLTLWGNLMAGGAGVEYYFGYALPENDLVAQDFRSRDKSWDYCRIALEFFRNEKIPFWEMRNANALVGNTNNDNSRFCLAKPGEIYLVYLPDGSKEGTINLDLSGVIGSFTVTWFNPRASGVLADGSVQSITASSKANLGTPPVDPEQDWLIVIRK